MDERQSRIFDAHTAYADEAGAVFYNLGWATGENFIHSNTDMGRLYSEEQADGTITHEWTQEAPTMARTEMSIELHDYEYHRNGVSGHPFWAIDFTLTETYGEDVRHHRLWATVDADSDMRTDDELPVYTEWRIIDPTNFHSNWRGDSIAELLKPEVEDLLKHRA